MVSDVSDGSTKLKLIRWGQRRDLINNYRAKTNIYEGSILTESMITPKDEVLTAGKSLVGISLKEGQFPSTLENGDVVAAYRVGNDAANSQSGSSGSGSSGSGDAATGSDNTLIAGHLIVRDLTASSNGLGDGGISVTVVVDTADAGKLAIAASANEVSLVLVPRTSD